MALALPLLAVLVEQGNAAAKKKEVPRLTNREGNYRII